MSKEQETAVYSRRYFCPYCEIAGLGTRMLFRDGDYWTCDIHPFYVKRYDGDGIVLPKQKSGIPIFSINDFVANYNGEVYIPMVMTVNGKTPDENGNVIVTEGEGGIGGTINLSIKDFLDNVSELPETGDKGDAYIVGTDIYYWNGTEWFKGDTIKGDTGEQGIKGDKGDKGDQGVRGNDGSRWFTQLDESQTPSDEIGEDGDYFLSDSGLVWIKAAGSWILTKISLKGADGSAGEQGEPGIQGDRGIQGEQGPKGDKGDTGIGLIPKGTLEDVSELPEDAEIGDTYVIDNIIYVFLENGKFSPIGTFAGPKGDKGDQGIQGERGEKGEQGIQGIEGPQGPKGDKGDQGSGINLKGSLESIDDLPISGEQGDAYLINKELYVWNGERFVSGGSVQGPKGDKGDQGIQGIQGIQGEVGPEGPKGEQGIQGERGLQGIQGEQGPQGPKGDKGAKGDKGDTGPEGMQGEHGPAGEVFVASFISDGVTTTFTDSSIGEGNIFQVFVGGIIQNNSFYTSVGNSITFNEVIEENIEIKVYILVGDISKLVLDGVKSVNGQSPDQEGNITLPIIPGPIGEKGDKGDKGDIGPKGDRGDKGEPGIQGLDGAKGDKGDTGAQGPKGERGVNTKPTLKTNVSYLGTGKDFRKWFGDDPIELENGVISLPTTTEASVAVRMDSNLDYLSKDKLFIEFGVKDKSKLSKVTLRLSNGQLSEFNKYSVVDGINRLPINLTGTETVSEKLTYLQFQVLSMGPGQDAGVELRRIGLISEFNTPSISIQFDDGLSSVYTAALPILKEFGLTADIGVIENFVGLPGHMTEQELKELQSLGWTLFNHTKNHENMASFNKEQVIEAVEGTRRYLDSVFNTGLESSYVAYPLGGLNSFVKEALRELNMVGRALIPQKNLLPNGDRFEYPTIEIGNQTTSSQVIKEITDSIEKKTHLNLLLHKVEDTPSGSISTSKTILKEIATFISKKVNEGELHIINTSEIVKSEIYNGTEILNRTPILTINGEKPGYDGNLSIEGAQGPKGDKGDQGPKGDPGVIYGGINIVTKGRVVENSSGVLSLHVDVPKESVPDWSQVNLTVEVAAGGWLPGSTKALNDIEFSDGDHSFLKDERGEDIKREDYIEEDKPFLIKIYKFDEEDSFLGTFFVQTPRKGGLKVDESKLIEVQSAFVRGSSSAEGRYEPGDFGLVLSHAKTKVQGFRTVDSSQILNWSDSEEPSLPYNFFTLPYFNDTLVISQHLNKVEFWVETAAGDVINLSNEIENVETILSAFQPFKDRDSVIVVFLGIDQKIYLYDLEYEYTRDTYIRPPAGASERNIKEMLLGYSNLVDPTNDLAVLGIRNGSTIEIYNADGSSFSFIDSMEVPSKLAIEPISYTFNGFICQDKDTKDFFVAPGVINFPKKLSLDGIQLDAELIGGDGIDAILLKVNNSSVFNMPTYWFIYSLTNIGSDGAIDLSRMVSFDLDANNGLKRVTLAYKRPEGDPGAIYVGTVDLLGRTDVFLLEMGDGVAKMPSQNTYNSTPKGTLFRMSKMSSELGHGVSYQKFYLHAAEVDGDATDIIGFSSSWSNKVSNRSNWSDKPNWITIDKSTPVPALSARKLSVGEEIPKLRSGDPLVMMVTEISGNLDGNVYKGVVNK